MGKMEDDAKKRFMEAEEREKKKRKDNEETAGRSNIIGTVKALIPFGDPNQFTRKTKKKIDDAMSNR